MNLHTTSLLVLASMMVPLAIYHASISVFVDDPRLRYRYFAVALLAAGGFMFCGSLLSGPLPDAQVVLVHRIRTACLMVNLTAYQYTLFDLYEPENRMPVWFLRISALLALLLPTDLYLREPIHRFTVELWGYSFHYRLGTTAIAYRIYSLLIVGGFIYTAYRIARSRPGEFGKSVGIVSLMPVIFGGSNDLLVAQGVIRNIMMSEYLYFIVLGGIFILFLREERKKQQQLELLNLHLEEEVAHRTRELEESNRVLAEEKEKLAESILRIRQLHGLLPICSCCKNVRNDDGYWLRVESYLTDHSNLEFTHSVCPECMQRLYPEVHAQIQEHGNPLPARGREESDDVHPGPRECPRPEQG